MELRKCVNHPLLLAGVRDASREALQDALLAETGAGKAVKALSKQTEDTIVAAAAKAVVQAWKKSIVG